jgi:hypothetical protein
MLSCAYLTKRFLCQCPFKVNLLYLMTGKNLVGNLLRCFKIAFVYIIRVLFYSVD